MNSNVKAVFFDLDGTLVHSALDIHTAANVVCKPRGWEPFDLETVTSYIGHGVPALVKQMFEARGASVEEADYQTAVMDFLAYYNEHMTDLTKVYDGIGDALDWLKSENIQMGVITNKPFTPAKSILDDLGIADYFSVLIGGDSTPAKKPDPAPYLAACEALVIEPSQTVYVGDSETDGKTAEGVNVPFVLFTGRLSRQIN